MLLIFMRIQRIIFKQDKSNKFNKNSKLSYTVNRVVRGSQSCSGRVSHSVAVCFRSVGSSVRSVSNACCPVGWFSI